MTLTAIAALPGVVAVCRFRDDGSLVEANGRLPEARMVHLARFAQWYRRAISGNTDLLSLLTRMPGWSPAQGWVVRGAAMSVCSVGNVVCLFEPAGGALDTVLGELVEAARD